MIKTLCLLFWIPVSFIGGFFRAAIMAIAQKSDKED